VTLLPEHVSWRTAAPLWPTAHAGTVDYARPEILRFATDDFMDRVAAELAGGGTKLNQFLARNETWRAPGAGLTGPRDPVAPVKLFQPSQGRFYLVAATLVCGRRGLPDRMVDPSRSESAFFVLRQLRRVSANGKPNPADASTFTEYAWIPGSAGTGAWKPASGAALADGEQRMPLFGIAYEALGGHRKLLAGLIPVGMRELLRSGPALPASTSGDPLEGASDPRLAPLLAPLDALSISYRQREQARFPLADTIFFAAQDLAAAISDAQAAKVASLTGGTGFNWREALNVARVSTATSAPPAFSQLADPAKAKTALEKLGVNGTTPPAKTTLFAQFAATLPPSPPAAVADDGAEENAVLVARCAYERPRCPVPKRLRLSPPSPPFVFSSLYDPDAPVRPARIPMPNDVDLATLARSPKGVSVALSKELRRQMDRFSNMKFSDVDSGTDPGAPPFSFGMVCSLSIPIITICALILLMIILSLLNLVFWWLPFFRICLPSVKRA
jgi:hypothetical protein